MRTVAFTRIINIKVTVSFILRVKCQAQQSPFTTVSNPFLYIQVRLGEYISLRINNIDCPGLINHKQAAVAGMRNTNGITKAGGKGHQVVTSPILLAAGAIAS
jgi:hypothetical protein